MRRDLYVGAEIFDKIALFAFVSFLGDRRERLEQGTLLRRKRTENEFGGKTSICEEFGEGGRDVAGDVYVCAEDV